MDGQVMASAANAATPARRKSGEGIMARRLHLADERPADLPRTFAWKIHELRQLDNLLYTFYAVIHRDLKDRMLFLDRQSAFSAASQVAYEAFVCRSTWRRNPPPSAGLRCVSSGT